MSMMSRVAPVLAALALTPSLVSGGVVPASDEGSRTGGSEGAFEEFIDASLDTGGDAFILAALYQVCLDQGYDTWMCADDGDDRISDGEDFPLTLEEMGNALNTAEGLHTRNPEYTIDEGYSGGFSDERDEMDTDSAANLRDQAREAWTNAIEALPIEDAEDISEDVFETALGWMVQGIAQRCFPAGGGGSASSGDADSGELEVPEEYVSALEEAADTSGLPAELLAAQIDQESSWNEEAASPAGARGLAQFMPDTWSQWGEGSFDPYPDPEASIRAQGEYMAHLMDMVESMANNDEEHIELALAAYNAGPGNVQEFAGVPPFPETEHYVVSIPEAANAMGADLVISASQGGCNSNYEVPDLDDVDCEAYQSGEHYDYQQGPQYPILLEDALHEAAQPGLMCGLVAFGADYDGELPNAGENSPFGTRSENNWGSGDVNTQIPSTLGMDHPWGGAIDVALDHQHNGGMFYWSQEGQEYGREIAEFYMEYAEELNVYMVIYWERQWFAHDEPKPWDEWDTYRGTQTGWTTTNSFGQDHSGYIQGAEHDNGAHRNHPHISFDPR